MKPPAFQFYADDFSAGTCDLSAADVGAYIRLLCYQWSRGSIPINDPIKLARIAGAEPSVDVLAKFPNGMNARLESEREKQAAYREAQAMRGKVGAAKRWDGERHSERHSASNGTATKAPMAQAQPEHSSPSPSPSPSPFTLTTTENTQSAPAGARIPTLEAWQAHCSSSFPDWPKHDSESAWDHYESLGWKKGKTPIVKWKSCAATCYRNFKDRPQNKSSARIGHDLPPDYYAGDGGWGQL